MFQYQENLDLIYPKELTCSGSGRIGSRDGRLFLQSFPLHFFHFLLHVRFFLQLFTFFLPLLTLTILLLHLFNLQLSNRLLLTLKTFKFTLLWKNVLFIKSSIKGEWQEIRWLRPFFYPNHLTQLPLKTFLQIFIPVNRSRLMSNWFTPPKDC